MADSRSEMNLVASRYAEALFELALEKNEADKVEADLKAVLGEISQNKILAKALVNPALRSDGLVKLVEKVASALSVSAITAKFLKVLAEKKRFGVFSGILAVYSARLAAKKGIEEAEVVSAAPLSVADENKVAEAVKAATGKQVRLKARVDASILGGVRVKIGSRLFDGSLATKLDKLGQELKRNTK